ncbi:hypothetical protein [Roseibium sp.]|uniref:hypothetical protein n=1 Tax=Roseibium sp. TaxID=1936156 RepID=UPI003B521798
MTANLRNTLSAMKVLETALEAYERDPAPKGGPRDGLTKAELGFAFNMRNLLNTARKCFESLAGELKYLQGATNHGRALIDENGDVIRGMAVETLHVPIDGPGHDVVIYGRADALAFVAEVLAQSGHQTNGPAALNELRAKLAASADQADRQEAAS